MKLMTHGSKPVVEILGDALDVAGIAQSKNRFNWVVFFRKEKTKMSLPIKFGLNKFFLKPKISQTFWDVLSEVRVDKVDDDIYY